jgi:GTP-binding protein Era
MGLSKMSKNNRCGFTAIVGRPNVGKSTLLNRIIGQKLAITSHKPQTTRHSILGVKTTKGGQIVYVDTPGMHKRGNQPMNRYLNRTAKSALGDVDLLLFVVEALRWTDEDESVLQTVIKYGLNCILIVNKVDRVKDKDELLPFIAELSNRHDFSEIIPLSASNGSNVPELERKVLAAMPEGDNIYPDDQLTDRSERFFAAELVREQLTQRYAKEIPYALTVEIEKFEVKKGVYHINALIWVERKGQKNIIIGKDGEALKEVATQARLEMQKLFEHKVFLKVWVKIKKSWSTDSKSLHQLGYGD